MVMRQKRHTLLYALPFALNLLFIAVIACLCVPDLLENHPQHIALAVLLVGLGISASVAGYLLTLRGIRHILNQHAMLSRSLEATPDTIFIKDLEGRYLRANRGFCEVMNTTPESVLFKTDKDIMPEELFEFLREQDSAVISSRKSLRFENWLNSQNTEDYILRETLKSPIIDENGNVTGIIGIGRDITDQHRVKIALHKRERLLAALTKATQHILQSTTSFTDAISPALGMLGKECQADTVLIFEEEEFSPSTGIRYRLQYSWWKADSGHQARLSRLTLNSQMVPLLQDLQRKNAITITDVRELPQEQAAALVELGFTSIILAAISFQGEFWGLLCVATFDVPRKWSLAENAAIEIAAGQFAVILQRQQTEESLYRTFDALRQSQSRLGIALQAANAVPFEFDLLDGGVNIDPSFFISLGYEKDWYPQNLSDTIFLIHPEEQKIMRSAIEAVASGTSETLSVVVRFRRCKGDYSWFNVMGTPRFDSDQPTSIIGLAQDITDKRRAENELLQSERMAAVGTLAAGVAHNFNNLNTGILGHLEMLQRKESLSDRGRAKLELVINTVKRSIDLTDSLLAFSGKRMGKRKEQLLAPLIQDTVGLIYNEFEADGITFSMQLDQQSTAFCSGGEICHVLFNLLVNARHAMLESEVKCITLFCGTEENRAYLQVSDTGCGIPEDALKNIFLPFYTTKGEHARPGSQLATIRGTGLGLSSSKTIVENHGGEITLESTVGKGTTFTIWLPAKDNGTNPW